MLRIFSTFLKILNFLKLRFGGCPETRMTPWVVDILTASDLEKIVGADMALDFETSQDVEIHHQIRMTHWETDIFTARPWENSYRWYGVRPSDFLRCKNTLWAKTWEILYLEFACRPWENFEWPWENTRKLGDTLRKPEVIRGLLTFYGNPRIINFS